MPLVALVVASILLAAPFGEATATAVDLTDGLTVEISVEYDAEASAVIARPFSDFEELPPTALAAQPDGTWAGWVVLPTAQNWQMAFEGFRVDGTSDLSEGTDLITLGVDPVVIESEVVEPLPDKPLLPEGSWWLIVAVVVGVLALVGLAYWAFGGEELKPEDEEAANVEPDVEPEVDEPT